MEFNHVSVLLDETVNNLITTLDGIYVDCTLGGAGHSLAIGRKLADAGTIIGLDQDDDALAVASTRLEQLSCKHLTIKTNFKDLKQALIKNGYDKVDGFVFDLGVSSYQLDTAERGFSYMQDGPLDMRMDTTQSIKAEDIINDWEPEDLIRIIELYGEERWAKRIVEFIVEERQIKRITRTKELVTIIKKAIPSGARRDGPHPAKRTFQAIRIAVNSELDILRKAFIDAANMLNKGGRICVITFHSLEDRITKQTFNELSKNCVCPPELPMCVCKHKAIVKGRKKAIEPSKKEIEINPRARSARLRFVEKL